MPLISTKLAIPPHRSKSVARSRLVDKLNRGMESGLVLVSAPAGYGKSTLLSEWARQSGMPVAWLSLEKSDNTSSQFWAYFGAALKTIPNLPFADLEESLLDLENPLQPASLENALTSLAAEIAEIDASFVVVLDDMHVITDSIIHQGLTFLIEHLPAPSGGMHLVVAGRKDPPWPLARMRARGEIFEIRTRDLRFELDESTEFLNRIMGLSLSTGDIERLEQRTEGWIAGLQMAALSMQNREDIPAFLDRFSGSHRFVLDYLIEEVLNQQPPEVMEFLLRTSILNRLNASLCDEVLGREGSQETLAQLERTNVFLFSLDDEQHWYRYHPLFSDLLRKKLSTDSTSQVPVLHQRASKWLEENGYLQDSILHAIDGGDMKQVARLVSGNILLLAEGDALMELLERVQSIPVEEMCSQPWLCISIAWAKAYAGRVDEAVALIDKMESALEGQVAQEDYAHLTGHGMTIRAYAEWIKGNFATAITLAHKANATIPADDVQEKANILIILGLAIQNAGESLAAIQVLRDAVSISLQSGNRYLYVYASSCLVFGLKGVGQLHEAFEICRETEKFAAQSGVEYFVLAIGLAAKGEILRLWNELDESLKAAQQAVALAEKWKQSDTLHYTLSVLIDAHLALGEFKEARSFIQRSKWISSMVSDWFMRITEFQEAKLNLACDNRDAYLQWKSRRCPDRVSSLMYYPLIARYLMIQKENKEALNLLDEGITTLQAEGLWGRTIELYLMKAVVLSTLGKKEKALSSLKTALKMAEPEGYVYLFVIQGKPLLGLLRQAIRKGIQKGYAQKILGIMMAAESKASKKGLKDQEGESIAGEDVTETLSERELEVLRLLNSQLSVPEIANELSVAPTTVRTHVRVIYNKLGAHGRIEAIQKARDLGLI